MKIAIVNAEAGGNKGAEAMLVTLIDKLQTNIPNVNIWLEVCSRRKYYEDVFLKEFDPNTVSTYNFKPKKIINTISVNPKEFDYVIDIGGLNFINSPIATLRSVLRWLPFVRNGVKLIFFTQDFGPTNSFYVKTMGRYILKRSRAVFVRSQKSKDNLEKNLRWTKNVFGPFPDSTLALEHSNNFHEMPNNYIVLSPSAIMYGQYGVEYLNFFKALYEVFCPKYKVIILVHNFTMNGSNSDEELCIELSKLCERAELYNLNESTLRLKAILSQAKFAVSSRYHVVVGSISQNTPALAVGWNPKYQSFLELYDKTEWNIDFRNNPLESVIEVVETTEFLNSQVSLAQRNVVLKEKVRDSFDKLLQIIREG